MSKADLGAVLDLNAFQIQKYEDGVSRLSAAKLFEIAGALGVPVSYFFDGLSNRGGAVEALVKASNDTDPASLQLLDRAEMKRLIAAFAHIDGARLRGCFLTLLSLLPDAKAGDDNDTAGTA